jgi:hypothetical protein
MFLVHFYLTAWIKCNVINLRYVGNEVLYHTSEVLNLNVFFTQIIEATNVLQLKLNKKWKLHAQTIISRQRWH